MYILGENVEGAFANGLVGVLQNVIGLNGVPESQDGDVSITTPGILDPDIQDQFQKMIWKPMQALRNGSEKSSTSMIDIIRNQNPNKWKDIRFELQKWNMATSK